jgi:hypothetical protein
VTSAEKTGFLIGVATKVGYHLILLYLAWSLVASAVQALDTYSDSFEDSTTVEAPTGGVCV